MCSVDRRTLLVYAVAMVSCVFPGVAAGAAPSDESDGVTRARLAIPLSQLTLDGVRRMNQSALSAPLWQRIVCPGATTARLLHYTFTMETVGQAACRLKMEYHEFGTDLKEEFLSCLIPLTETGRVAARLPPHWTIRGIKSEVRVKVLDASLWGLPSPALLVDVRNDFLKEEAEAIRNWDPRRLFVVVDGSVIDRRYLSKIASIYGVADKMTFTIKSARVASGAASPWGLACNAIVSIAVDSVVDGVVKKHATVTIRSARLKCGKCGREIKLRRPEGKVKVLCSGCGVTTTLTLNFVDKELPVGKQ